MKIGKGNRICKLMTKDNAVTYGGYSQGRTFLSTKYRASGKSLNKNMWSDNI